jgi:hypothetical protein
VYQIHQPGVSALLLPGYVIDRIFLSTGAGYQNELPRQLILTNITMLLLYGWCGISVLRLLSNALPSQIEALVWCVAALTTLPTSAFAFQFYPELPALLVIATITNWVLFSKDKSDWSAFGAGLATGGLCWLHPRFLLVSGVLTVAALGAGSKRERKRYLLAYALVLISLGWFQYHVTGSWSPTAIWKANDPSPLTASSIPSTLLAYLFHPDWGLIPHAPILILAFPGMLLLVRQSWRHALLLAVLWLSLVVPAAGHTLTAAGGTPGRLVLAVVPLFFWPVALGARRFSGSTAARTVVVILAVMSLNSSLAYNLHHVKSFGLFRNASFIGWAPNLAFPLIREAGWTSSPFTILGLAVIALVVIAISIAALTDADLPSKGGRIRRSVIGPSWATAFVVCFFTMMTSLRAAWFREQYLVDDLTARRAAASALVTLDRCAVCFSTNETAMDWTRLSPNPVTGLNLYLSADRTQARASVQLEGDSTSRGFGRVRLDFGDKSQPVTEGVVEQREFSHSYRQPGTYEITAWLKLPNGDMRVARSTVTIRSDR